MSRRILMIAFHFPPFAGSSGVQRTLRFVRHLPKHGWQPIVLSAQPQAYETTSPDLLQEVPAGTVVRRAFALNSARHLAIRGRYLAFTARPDRWISWKFDAIRQGMAMIAQYRPQLIWSTYPIATAHVIGAELARRSGLPWVADFRDPMAQPGYPADPVTWQQFSAIERRALEQAALSTFTTPGAVQIYRQRYPARAERIQLLENGYDEESFLAAARQPTHSEPLLPGCLTLLHSGIVYPEERDPVALFRALQQLRERRPQTRLRIRFRASTQDGLLRQLAERFKVAGLIELQPALPYADALAEMLRADALLILQAANCNAQIPAKLYEYLRAGRPVVALTDAAGDTAASVRQAGFDWLAALDDAAAIAALLARVEDQLLAGQLPKAHAGFVQQASRAARTAQLAGHLDRLAGVVA